MANFSTLFAEQSTSIAVSVTGVYDDREIWTGVMTEGEGFSAIDWITSIESEFSIKIPDSESDSVVVFLKRDFVPIVLPITSKIIADGIAVEFEDGLTIMGSVVTKKDSIPITEGSLSLTYDDTTYRFSPPFPNFYSWKIEEDGSFVIKGVPPGKHTVSDIAPGFMPDQQSVEISSEVQPHELVFVLPTAEYIEGQIVV